MKNLYFTKKLNEKCKDIEKHCNFSNFNRPRLKICSPYPQKAAYLI